jgi:hypothetical protein
LGLRPLRKSAAVSHAESKLSQPNVVPGLIPATGRRARVESQSRRRWQRSD